MVWFKRDSLSRLVQLYRQYCRRTFPVRSDRTSSRDYRNHRHYKRYRLLIYYYLALCVLPVSAEEPRVQNTSNPVAAATGNVTNQAVQIQNSGAPSRQYFGPNNSCNGATLNVTPFLMGSNTSPYDYHSRTTTANWGLQASVAIPLDGGMIEQCKSIAARHEDKMRLDYELTRALKCSEIQKNGFMLRPGSRVAHMCSDVVAITAYEKESNRRPIQRTPQFGYEGIPITDQKWGSEHGRPQGSVRLAQD